MNFGYVEEMETRSDQFSQSMKNAQSNAADAGSEIANAFQRALASVEELTEALDNLKEPVGRISESLELVAKVDFSGMSSDLAEISATLTDVLEKLQETDWIGIAGLVMQAFSQGFDIFSWMNPKDFSKVEELGITTAGITDFVQTEVLPSKVLGTANYADELAEAAAGSGMLSVGFNKLREALDGVNLSQIAATASQWIQNAAVTAWNGICGAASPGRLKTVLYRSTRNYAGRDNFCRVWPVITRIRRLNGGPYPGGLERGAQPLVPRSGYRSGDKKLSAAAYRPSPRAARGIQRMEKPGQIWPR